MPLASRLHDIVAQANDLAPSSRARYLSDLDRWIAYAGASPQGWTRYQAAAFYADLLTRMRPQSANRLMASVAYASHWWAHYEGRPELDFAVVQTAPPADKKPQRALTQAEATALLATCAAMTPVDMRDFALLVTALETGMRRMSLLSMQVETTGAGLKGGPTYPATRVALKGKPAAWVPLSDTAVAALTPWLTSRGRRLKGPVFVSLQRRTSAKTGRNEWFPGASALTPAVIGQVLDRRCAQAGVVHVHPHMLRHTFVTWRIEAGSAPHEIAAITRHDLKGGLGAMGGYMDLARLGETARQQTPAWLAQIVAAWARQRPELA